MGITRTCRPSLVVGSSVYPPLTSREGPAWNHALVADTPYGTAFYGVGVWGNYTGNLCVDYEGRLYNGNCLMNNIRICTYACACSHPTALGCSCICYNVYACVFVDGYNMGLAYTDICGTYCAGGSLINFCIPHNCAKWEISGSSCCCWDTYYYGVVIKTPVSCNGAFTSVCGCCDYVCSNSRVIPISWNKIV